MSSFYIPAASASASAATDFVAVQNFLELINPSKAENSADKVKRSLLSELNPSSLNHCASSSASVSSSNPELTEALKGTSSKRKATEDITSSPNKRQHKENVNPKTATAAAAVASSSSEVSAVEADCKVVYEFENVLKARIVSLRNHILDRKLNLFKNDLFSLFNKINQLSRCEVLVHKDHAKQIEKCEKDSKAEDASTTASSSSAAAKAEGSFATWRNDPVIVDLLKEDLTQNSAESLEADSVALFEMSRLINENNNLDNWLDLREGVLFSLVKSVDQLSRTAMLQIKAERTLTKLKRDSEGEGFSKEANSTSLAHERRVVTLTNKASTLEEEITILTRHNTSLCVEMDSLNNLLFHLSDRVDQLSGEAVA